MTTSVNFWPGARVTGLVAKATFSPVPPVTVEDKVTGPAKPALLMFAKALDGLLPIVRVDEPVEPDAKLTVAGALVTLKSCGRTEMITLIVLDPEGSVPVARVVTEYVPVAAVAVHATGTPGIHAGILPRVNVAVEEPDAPVIVLGV